MERNATDHPHPGALDALAARAESETFDRLIYLFGNARGGTSFLRSVFDLHPGVLAFDGPTHFLNHVWRHRRKVTDRLWRLIFWMPFFDARQRLRKAAPAEERERFEAKVNQALSGGDLNRIYRCYPMIKAADPEGGVALDAVHAWVDKGNDCWGIDALAAAFPRGRFVAIVRDPRAAIASLAGRLAGRRTGSPSDKEVTDVTAAAIYWTNWSSMILWNRRHPANAKLTVEMVNAVPGRDLHRFCWLEDGEIGALPATWNWLEGHSDPAIDPKVIHYTRGGPWFGDWRHVVHADLWLAERDAMLESEERQRVGAPTR